MGPPAVASWSGFDGLRVGLDGARASKWAAVLVSVLVGVLVPQRANRLIQCGKVAAWRGVLVPVAKLGNFLSLLLSAGSVFPSFFFFYYY
jgi:hypothetical protein